MAIKFPSARAVAWMAAAAAALLFVGFIAAGFYAAVDENIGAAMLSFLILVGSLLCGLLATVTFFVSRRSRPTPRGFEVTFPPEQRR